MASGKVNEILAVFQEGIIEEMTLIENDLNIKIECKYLAEQINFKYSYFYGVLKDLKDIYFVPWDDEYRKIRSLEELNAMKPDILGVDEDNDYIKIYSNCTGDYTGGNLWFSAKSIKIFDEDFQELYIDDLMELSDKYWYSSRAQG